MMQIDLEKDAAQDIADKILESLKVVMATRGIDYNAICNAPIFEYSLQQLLNGGVGFGEVLQHLPEGVDIQSWVVAEGMK